MSKHLKIQEAVKEASRLLPWIIWIFAVSFYAYEFVQRVSMSVYLPPLMHDLHLDATAAGMLGGSFYYAYAIMQLPVGVITDHFGPKRPALFGLALMIIGTLMMSQMHSLDMGLVARFLVGLGGAFAFICTMQFIILYFPHNALLALQGSLILWVMLVPVRRWTHCCLCQHYGWRTTMVAQGL